MALKNCKECGSQISDKAVSCPICGAKQPKKTSIIALVLAGLVLLVVISGILKKNDSDKEVAQNSNTATKDVKQPVQNWIVTESTDEMRNTKSVTMTNISKNSVDFEFPYQGGSNLHLIVRNRGGEKDLIIGISKGQFTCSSYQGCNVQFKFDDQAIQTIEMVGSDSRDSDVLFVSSSKTTDALINRIANSRKLVVEPNFYKEGKRQFTFDLDGFKKP